MHYDSVLNQNPKISVCIPIHEMENGAFFLWRAINSILDQSFKDYEIIITKEGLMPINSNASINKAKGEIVKVLYMDDWLESSNYLERLNEVFDNSKIEWVITGATTNLNPSWTNDLEKGNNKLGSPSALAFRNRFKANLLFDEKLSWLLDCDLYKRMYERYGSPLILPDIQVGIGIHKGQATNLMSEDYKLTEHEYVQKKYA